MNGDVENGPATDYFQALQLYTGRSRPHVMRTVQSISDVSMTAKVAILLQPLSLWSQTNDGSSTRVFVDADPHWAVPGDLGPWETVFRNLILW